MNDWFDVFNSRVPLPNSIHRKAGYGLAFQEQNEILDNMYHRMENTLIGNNKSLLPFQKGILKTLLP